MISSIVKCHLLDEELVKMTIDALETIYPYSDETIIVTTKDSIIPDYFYRYLDANGMSVVMADKGFSHFITTGIQCAIGDTVAVLNNDILFEGDWAKQLQWLFDPDTLLVHPEMLGWGENFHVGYKVRDNIDPKEGMFFSAFLVNKRLFNELGWSLDYDYWGYDDWDFYYRARKAGYNCKWTDLVQYKHKGGATIGKIGRENFEQKNKELFIEKHEIDPALINWYKL